MAPDTSPQIPHTVGHAGYAVVSCHVERPLDDRVWAEFSKLLRRRGGRIAALLRPPDHEAGESAERWLERAREAEAQAPFGHHTHFGGPTQARPLAGGTGERVRREGAWLHEVGLEPRFFCGGGWYMDADVAEAAAELGYADCTATAFRPSFLPPGAARLSLERPAWLRLPNGSRLLELPTTHSLGMAARELIRPRGLRAPVVHVHFHDTDLIHASRRAALGGVLALLGRRRSLVALTELERVMTAAAPEVPLGDAAQGEPVGRQ